MTEPRPPYAAGPEVDPLISLAAAMKHGQTADWLEWRRKHYADLQAIADQLSALIGREADRSKRRRVGTRRGQKVRLVTGSGREVPAELDPELLRSAPQVRDSAATVVRGAS